MPKQPASIIQPQLQLLSTPQLATSDNDNLLLRSCYPGVGMRVLVLGTETCKCPLLFTVDKHAWQLARRDIVCNSPLNAISNIFRSLVPAEFNTQQVDNQNLSLLMHCMCMLQHDICYTNHASPHRSIQPPGPTPRAKRMQAQLHHMHATLHSAKQISA